MLKKVGIALSIFLFIGILMSCEKQETNPEVSQEEIAIGNLEGDMIIKVDPVSENVLLSGEEVDDLEIRFEEDEETEEVYFARDGEVTQRCLKYREQLLLIQRSEEKSSIAKMKDILDPADRDELWDLCEKEFETLAQE